MWDHTPDLAPFERAIENLEEALVHCQSNATDALVRDGLIWRFNLAYQQACKIIKHYLKHASASSIDIDLMDFPDQIRTANQYGLLLGEWVDWRGFREMRHNTHHNYDDETSLAMVENMPRFVEEAVYLRDKLRRALEIEITPNIDLRSSHLEIVRKILKQHIPNHKVAAFGSRARWTARKYSDLDLVVLNDEPLPSQDILAIKEDLSESDLPFKVDVVEWAKINESFRNIIGSDVVLLQTPEPESV